MMLLRKLLPDDEPEPSADEPRFQARGLTFGHVQMFLKRGAGLFVITFGDEIFEDFLNADFGGVGVLNIADEALFGVFHDLFLLRKRLIIVPHPAKARAGEIAIWHRHGTRSERRKFPH